MIYLKEFKLLTDDAEWEFFRYRSQGCYDSFYPYQIFPRKRLETIIFSDITIFCGSNGSGKSTILNIIAEKLQLKRNAPYNKTDFFATYISGCNCEFYYADSKNMQKLLSASRIISSDDVFNHILDVRKRNYRLISKRKKTLDDIADIKREGWANGPRGFNAKDPESIKSFIDYCQRLRGHTAKYIRNNVGVDERTYSNGENGFKYFIDIIQPDHLYLLDEPENSLSIEKQLQLVRFLLDMSRFYKCQFIISTHSPFILSIPFARIYNMDDVPVSTCRWTDLPNVRSYYNFFKDHQSEFE